ncbi:hypothetical protein [Streptomyces sp. A0642]|uniref:hypothetical protein n=1 Tax=Streptomyces sp. A0642 TaxID=2563100 RepID=UPI001444C61D|nr:hypothetical protein [Streptomyces sp. A0642]
MTDEQNERRIYRLDNDHDFEWADLEEFVPDEPKVPEELRPLFPTGKTVDEVGELRIRAYDDEPPRFSEGEASVEATAQEMAEWRAAWARMEEEQQALRARLRGAQEAYEATVREALADLAEAMKPWGAVEAVLKERAAELAEKLHIHRTAAEEWKAAREAKEQEHLDTIDGPRVIVLYKPNSLGSGKQADHIAKVHLVACKRRNTKGQWFGASRMDDDEGLRAGEAWYRLTHPAEWIRSAFWGNTKAMRVKFCSACKPWTVFQEHIEDFPTPCYSNQGMTLGGIRLTDIPEGWTS